MTWQEMKKSGVVGSSIEWKGVNRNGVEKSGDEGNYVDWSGGK